MEKEATKTKENQLVLFSGGEPVEDLIYEFLKDRSPLTEKAYQRDIKAFFEFTPGFLIHNIHHTLENKDTKALIFQFFFQAFDLLCGSFFGLAHG